MRSSYKASNKKLLPILSQAPQGSIQAFPPTQDRPQLAPVSSPVSWAGTRSPDRTFQHAWASRQCAVPCTWACGGEAAHPGPFVPHFEAMLWLSPVHSSAQPFSGTAAEQKCLKQRQWGGLAVAGHQVPPKATLSLPSSAGQGRESIMKSS